MDSMISQRHLANGMNESKIDATAPTQTMHNMSSAADLQGRLPLYADPDRVFKLQDYLKRSVQQVNHAQFTSKYASKTHRNKLAQSTPKLGSQKTRWEAEQEATIANYERMFKFPLNPAMMSKNKKQKQLAFVKEFVDTSNQPITPQQQLQTAI